MWGKSTKQRKAAVRRSHYIKEEKSKEAKRRADEAGRLASERHRLQHEGRARRKRSA